MARLHRGAWLPQVALVTVAAFAYANSFRGVFIFDDLDIPKNIGTVTLWPPWAALSGPNLSRPLIGLSLAINYVVSGFDVWSYHFLNLTIHLIAGLALFGIVRRTLLNPRLSDRFGRHSTGLALVIALVWLVHPLQTQSVTYIIQRAESLMGMFYLLTLYCVIRGADSQNSRPWYVAAVVACAAGMLSKQVMVTAPIVIFIYDCLFLSGSFVRALRKRAGLYAGLAVSWVILAALIIAAPASRTAGFAVTSITPWDYFKSQFGVIVHYLRLSFWPGSLCLDYGWPKPTSAAQIIPYALIVVDLEAATLWALIRRRPVAFLGVWFFGILSLTSSFMPIADLAFEHRMYLSLAALVALIVLGAYAIVWRLPRGLAAHEVGPTLLRDRIAIITVIVVTGALCFLTLRRNQDYNSGVAMWTDVASKWPTNPRAHNNLGLFLAKQGDLDQAIPEFNRSLQIDPGYADAHENLGMTLVQQGNLDDAIEHFRRAVEIDPTLVDAYTKLGAALANQKRIDEAFAAFSKALAISPDYGPALANMGFAQQRQGRTEDAIASFERALPHLANNDLAAHIHVSLGDLMQARGETSQAAFHYQEALRLKPGLVPAEQRMRQIIDQENAKTGALGR
jgi:tetratricopeptide (TPR) repeat protein